MAYHVIFLAHDAVHGQLVPHGFPSSVDIRLSDKNRKGEQIPSVCKFDMLSSVNISLIVSV